MVLKNITNISLLLIFLFLCLFHSCNRQAPASGRPTVDAILIGGGIMSATLAALLKELDPDLSLDIYERLDQVALESSAALNNAGTGHQSFCELNYTPELEDGRIDLKKALNITEEFEISKQFWAYFVEKNKISSPNIFINSVPQLSFVFGDENVSFLNKRYLAMVKHPFYHDMEYTEDPKVIEEWAPLIMEGRPLDNKFAATMVKRGVDVDFGKLTRLLFESVKNTKNTKLFLSHEIEDLVKNEDATWSVVVKNLTTKKRTVVNARFVFIGAGGASLTLLQKSGIPESKMFGGFPVGGAWLITDKTELIDRHFAKVYGKAEAGSPPMSVPHLDTRFIDGKRSLIFGPFATYSTKFLKYGSWFALPMSVTVHNFWPMLEVGFEHFGLVRYLIGQVLMTENQRIDALRVYFPRAKAEDFYHALAGQRVQIIKNDEKKGGTLQFGTELVVSKDKSLCALLGASPGASIAVKAMLNILEESFKDRMKRPDWQSKLKDMIPSYGQKLADNPSLMRTLEDRNRKLLKLAY